MTGGRASAGRGHRNPPTQPWYRYAAVAAALGALTGPVGTVRPAVDGIRESPPAGANNAASELAYDSGVDQPSSVPLAGTRNNGRGVQGETINVVIPRYDGVLAITVSNAPVELSLLSSDKRTIEFTGQLPAMTISDNRYLSTPGWSVTGQVSDFSGEGRKIDGSDLGWTPEVITQPAPHDVLAGPTVSPGTRPGLTEVSILATAAATKGTGTTLLSATLDLKVPANAKLDSQSATLFVTLVEQA